MSDATGENPYEVVLRDLRQKREKIDAAIAAIEELAGGVAAVASQPAPSAAADNQTHTGADYLGMSIAEAAKKLLAKRRRAMGNAEIAKELQDGGLVLTSADPVNTIGSVVTRRFNQVGDIVRVGRGMWGLKEWYPNRSFAKARTGVTNGDPIEPAPLSRPTEPAPEA